MFQLVVLLLATALPWAVGYWTANYWAALLPAAAAAAAALNYAAAPDVHRDEVDVWPAILLVCSALAVIICLAGAGVRRRSQKHS
jgi:hypothetical protein